MSNKDEQAFTVSVYDRAGDKLIVAGGLTKREYAAIQITAALVWPYCEGDTRQAEYIANVAVRFTDALFAELKKGPT